MNFSFLQLLFKRLSQLFALMCILVLGLGVFLSSSEINIRGRLNQRKHPLFYDYPGVTHASTKGGRGSQPTKYVLQSAAESNISFLFLTDLNDFSSKQQPYGYHQDVLLLPGKKVSHLDSHLLLYSKKKMSEIDSLGKAAMMVNDLTQQPLSGQDPFVVVAHPFKKGFHWNQAELPHPSGIEVINLRHLWQQAWLNKKASFIWSLYLYIFNPKIALIRLLNEPQKELQLWDQLNDKSKTIGFLGNNTVGRIFHLGPFSFAFPTYRQSFEFASNHVLLSSELTGIAERDTPKVVNALKKGQFYMSIDALADPVGFATYLTRGKNVHPLGAEVEFTKGLKLHVDVPQVENLPMEVKVYRNGNEWNISKDLNSQWELTEPGNYRVYVRIRLKLPIPGELRWVPWIYTNYFYVR